MQFAFLSPQGVEPDLDQLYSSPVFAFDTEVEEDSLVGISIANRPNQGYFFPHDNLPLPLLTSGAVKLGHNIKYDLPVLKQKKLSENISFDAFFIRFYS